MVYLSGYSVKGAAGAPETTKAAEAAPPHSRSKTEGLHRHDAALGFRADADIPLCVGEARVPGKILHVAQAATGRSNLARPTRDRRPPAAVQ